MDILWPLLGGLAVLLGLAGIVLPILPGTPLLFAGFWLLAWDDGFVRVGMWTLVVLGGLAVLAWLVDYLAALFGVKLAGASRQALAGAAIGTVLGLLGGLPGVLIGPVLGAVIGEWLARRNGAQASLAGLAAGFGFLIGMVAKLALAGMMVGIFAIAWLF